MADIVKVKLNLPGLNELMKSEGIAGAVEDAAKAVADAAGGDYGTSVNQGRWIAIANVFPESKEAAKENYEDNTLLKAIGAVGLVQTK